MRVKERGNEKEGERGVRREKEGEGDRRKGHGNAWQTADYDSCVAMRIVRTNFYEITKLRTGGGTQIFISVYYPRRL